MRSAKTSVYLHSNRLLTSVATAISLSRRWLRLHQSRASDVVCHGVCGCVSARASPGVSSLAHPVQQELEILGVSGRSLHVLVT